MNTHTIQQFRRCSIGRILKLLCLLNVLIRLGSAPDIGAELFTSLKDRYAPEHLVLFENLLAIKGNKRQTLSKSRAELRYPPIG